MDVRLPSELERKLARLAEEQGRDRDALVVEAVERLVDHEAWFLAEVERGLADLEAGQVFSHEEVGERLEARLNERRSA
jgi:predicted transcriptional regulator